MNKRTSITREQVDKLLEMCRDSFPEYSNITFETKRDTNEVWFDNKPDLTPDPHEYHWFELCLTELPKVIFEKLYMLTMEDKESKYLELQSSFQTGGELLFFTHSEGLHVIDTLYKEYKKLKNGKNS